MSESKHTPGPWSVVPAPTGDDINIAAPYPVDFALAKAHPNGFAVACAWALWDRDGGERAQMANARLIAAAPDYDIAAGLAITALAFEQERAQRAGDELAFRQITTAKNALIAAQNKARGRDQPPMRDVTPGAAP